MPPLRRLELENDLTIVSPGESGAEIIQLHDWNRSTRADDHFTLPTPPLSPLGTLSSVDLADTKDNSNSQSMSMATEAELTDAKLRTVGAETDAKFAQVLGEIRLSASDVKGEIGKIATRLDNVERSTGG